MKKAVNVLLLVSVLISGCMTFSGGNLQNVSVKPPSRPIRVEVTAGKCDFSNCFSGEEAIDVREGIVEHWKGSGVIEEYSFVENANFTRQADYNITLTIFNKSSLVRGGPEKVLPVLLWSMLACLPPYISRVAYEVTYVAENTKTGERFKGKLKTLYTKALSIVLLPAVPAAGVGKSKMYKKIAENIFADLQKQGAFL